MDRDQAHSRSRRAPRRRVAIGVVSVLALGVGLGACSDDEEPTATGGGEGTTPMMTSPRPSATSSSTTTEATATTGSTTTEATAPPTTPGGDAGLVLDQRCENPLGFSVAYPTGWFTNTDPAPEPCVWFAPVAITVPTEATDALLGPVSIRIQEGVSLADVANPSQEFEQTVSSEQLTVAGRPAVRIESVATGQGLLDQGTRILAYAVEVAPAADGTPRVLTATSIECCNVAFDDATPILDAMVATLDITA